MMGIRQGRDDSRERAAMPRREGAGREEGRNPWAALARGNGGARAPAVLREYTNVGYSDGVPWHHANRYRCPWTRLAVMRTF